MEAFYPPNLWVDKTEEEYTDLFNSFLLDEKWELTEWVDLSDEEIEEWYENVRLHISDEDIEF